MCVHFSRQNLLYTVLPSVTIFSPAHSRCFTLRRGRPKEGCEQQLPPHPRPSEAAHPSAASRQSRAVSRLGPMRAQSTLQLPHRAGEEELEKCLHTPSLHPSTFRKSQDHQAAEPTSRPLCLPRTLALYKMSRQTETSTPRNISEARLEKCLGCRAPTMRCGVMQSPC